MPLLVDLLLGLAFVALNVALHLLGLVSGEGSDNAVFLALYMVGGAFHLTLGLPGFVLGFTGSVLLLGFKGN
jgi:hypothetical protein